MVRNHVIESSIYVNCTFSTAFKRHLITSSELKSRVVYTKQNKIYDLNDVTWHLSLLRLGVGGSAYRTLDLQMVDCKIRSAHSLIHTKNGKKTQLALNAITGVCIWKRPCRLKAQNCSHSFQLAHY